MSAESGDDVRIEIKKCLNDLDVIVRSTLQTVCDPDKPHHDLTIDQLLDLLVEKETRLADMTKTATESISAQAYIDELHSHNEKCSSSIYDLQRRLVAAEKLLASGIYEARLRLSAVDKAAACPVDPEEVVRYAHRISSCDSVCAPLDWRQGDIRRPYPSESEMQHSSLNHLPEVLCDENIAVAHLNDISEQSGVSVTPYKSPAVNRTSNKTSDSDLLNQKVSLAQNCDVEVMSTDSSSSSSSESP